MIRAALPAAILAFAAPAFAQQADGGSAAPSPAATSSNPDIEQLRRELLEQARKEADARVERAKEEMRNEVRGELATQSANRAWEEEWQEQKKKLDLLELNGYLRVRPVLLHDMDLSRGQDPTGAYLYPRPAVDPNTSQGRTQSWVDMRFRLEPTINVSEDIRLRTQLDILDNLILGSTPELDTRYPSPFFSLNQVSPSDAIHVKRAYAEVNTPVGLLSFGRMGSNWGLGILTNDGNCLDCDYGDSVDRIQFAARIAGYYVVPMFDWVGQGTNVSPFTDPRGNGIGQRTDRDQVDDVAGPFSGPVFTLAVAKRDSDRELQRKLDAGESSLNYGVYFSYRRLRSEITQDAAGNTSIIDRNAAMYTPDVWLRFMNGRLRLELEVAGLFGSIDNRALVPTNDPQQRQGLTMTQIGAAAQGEVKLLDGHLHVTGEVGYASGDRAPGLGNTNVLGDKPTVSGQIDGPQYNCSGTTVCADSTINNFRFNRDHRIDNILWREILGGVTDAIYFRPGVRYDIAEGFGLYLNGIYSRTVFSASSPSGTNPNLGIEFDPGVEYRSDDGFIAKLDYGILIPMAGLQNPPNAQHSSTIDASLAHAIRATFAVKF